jgi:H+-transporting ATPase
VVKLSLGAVVAADVKLTGGEVLLDQSMLTGESVPIEAGVGVQTYAGALVRRGEAEAEAEVTATGARTKFGRTAELVRTAHVVSTQQTAVLRVVRNLAAFNGAVIVLVVTYAWYIKMPVADIVPLVLTAILASIPVARTIGPRIRINRLDDASRRCSVSNRPDQPNASCLFTPPFTTRSTSNVISHPAARFAS